jgi:peptide/nickel transport system permease protein
MPLLVKIENFQKSSWLKEMKLTWKILRSNAVSSAGLIIFGLLIICVIFGPLFAPYGMNDINLSKKLNPPSYHDWFGTDVLGRDILSRVIYGARISFLAGIVIVGITSLFGGIVGLVAGYMSKYLGDILMRVTDIFMAFPTFILALALASTLGPSLWNALFAMSLVYWPRYARIVYGQTLSLKENEYVKYAETLRESPIAIMLRHIFPNMLGALIVQVTLDLGDVIILVACLGFVGLGAQPPTPDWGNMVSSGRSYMMNAWWMPIIPGLAIFVVVVAFNLIGDGLRDALDPNLRRTKIYKNSDASREVVLEDE